MAQQVEHVLGKDEVTGSNPVSSSKRKKERTQSRSFFRLTLPLDSYRWPSPYSVLRSKTDEARSVKKTGLNVLFSASGEQFTIATGTTGSDPVLRKFMVLRILSIFM